MHAPCAAAQDRIPTLEPLIDTCVLRVPDLLWILAGAPLCEAAHSTPLDDSTRESLIDTCQTMGQFIRHTPREYILTCVHILVGNCLYHVEPSWDFFPYSASDSSSKETFRSQVCVVGLGITCVDIFRNLDVVRSFVSRFYYYPEQKKLVKLWQIRQNKYWMPGNWVKPA